MKNSLVLALLVLVALPVAVVGEGPVLEVEASVEGWERSVIHMAAFKNGDGKRFLAAGVKVSKEISFDLENCTERMDILRRMGPEGVEGLFDELDEGNKEAQQMLACHFLTVAWKLAAYTKRFSEQEQDEGEQKNEDTTPSEPPDEPPQKPHVGTYTLARLGLP